MKINSQNDVFKIKIGQQETVEIMKRNEVRRASLAIESSEALFHTWDKVQKKRKRNNLNQVHWYGIGGGTKLSI